MNVLNAVRMSALLLAMLAAPTLALAQADGRFTGAVLDSTGAIVPNAVVIIKNERTGEERTATTNAEGRYTVTGLKPSVYTIRVTVAKFAPLEYTGMALAAAQEFAIDLTLQPEGLTEQVVVHGSA